MPTPKTEKAAPKKRVRTKKEEVLTDQPGFDPLESHGMETCWVEESEGEVREGSKCGGANFGQCKKRPLATP